MKKHFFIFYFLFFVFCFLFVRPSLTLAAEQLKIELDPLPCSVGADNLGDCPKDIIYPGGETCVTTFDAFKVNPAKNHFWVLDPEVTNQGKANERARQFIYWAINKGAIDNHSVLRTIWSTTKNVALFLFILVVAIMGLIYIIGQRTAFQRKIDIWPTIIKVAAGLLYIFMSYAIVIVLIQLSEVLMKFFIENLGGRDLFNIYYVSSSSQEQNYVNWIGCRDLNLKVQEAVRAEIFLLKLTNLTYYIMGTMVILRKIILWFLLFVAPFLAILFPFVFIRNVAWIWIGVFFQWLFYGPLFAIFLGALATIWKAGIPFAFDFSRAGSALGYIYPTGMSIVYGGPAQVLGPLNNGNYIDTFMEYVITLIMLWAVIFFPWWLLRIFRDYCCEGINATKNILLSMYDQMRGNPPSPGPISPQTSTPSTASTALKMPREVDIPVRIKLETVEEIRKTKTEDISRSLNLQVSRLTDIAHFETDKQVRETVNKNINYLKNPIQAETPIERQKYMNIRSELFNRAIKEDHIAKQVLSAVSTSKIEQMQRRTELLQTVPQATSTTHIMASKNNISQEKVKSLTSSFVNTTTQNASVINNIAQTTNLKSEQVQTVLSSFAQNVDQSITNVAQKVSQTTGLTKDKVIKVFKAFSDTLKTNKDIIKTVAQKEKVKEEDLQKFVETQSAMIEEPEKHIEQAISIPPTVSIEEYEDVKKMWVRQYEKGEVPVTENVTSRQQWVDQDTVLIANTLNKLMSTDEKLKEEGLDDVGYILPIFLINNLKGDELVVYLKAKLEAAKQVEEQLNKEKEITEKLKAKSEEELVEVETPKKQEKAQEMTMEAAQEIKKVI